METQTTEGEVSNESGNDEDNSFEWNAAKILQSIAVFFLAGVCEIVGGWMVWVAVRGQGGKERRPWWYALFGSMILICYGFVPCLQPTDSFGRIYAAYGGLFIVFSFLFGWAVDGDKPDIGDIAGGVISLGGACVIMFWPRS